MCRASAPATRDARSDASVVIASDDIAAVSLDAPSLPQRVIAIGAFFAYLAAGLALALTITRWAEAGLSIRVLLSHAGLVGRRRAPPVAHA